MYVIEDPKRPAPEELRSKTLAEQLFMQDYLASTGILWRHFYDESGPRPPPVLHMWKTERVGQVHEVTSSNGYWLVIHFRLYLLVEVL